MSDSKQPEVWMVRHGQTEWSRDGKHTSHTDLPLTTTGEAAARGLAPRLADVQFDLVLSSPRRRSHTTAHLAGFDAAATDDDLREWDYGDDEGRSTMQIREDRPGWSIWKDGPRGGETVADVGARADRVVQRIRAETTERALLFGHGHFSRVLAMRWCGLDVSTGEHFRLDTGGVSILGWYREVPAIARWNG